MCKNNLKQIGLGVHNYFEQYRGLPLAVSGLPPHSWRIDLLPQVDGSPLYKSYQLSEEWNSTANRPIATADLWSFRCPAMKKIKDAQGRYFSSYLLPVAEGGIYSPDGPLPLDKIPDGMGATMLVVENCNSKIVWTQPRDVNIGPAVITKIPDSESKQAFSKVLSSPHHQGAHMLLADGRVRFLSEKTSPAVLSSLILADDGKPDSADF